ncbi:hypothetical protein [Mycolicibacterium baixiangningiae]|uniref:hypothetical protein n=1 Tax=Mycolicibacterium baixiangningiae TaxID=2761578 RepID=UPI0018676946|nr:hypothetical protein [Mycolicibacterium baixiangningiae]
MSRVVPRIRRRIAAWWSPPSTRVRTRRRLLILSTPILILAVLAVTVIIRFVVVGQAAVDAFNDHDIAALRENVEKLSLFGIMDPAAVRFAEGDTLVLEGRLVEAEVRFADALNHSDTESSCAIRVNLELVRETLADLAVGTGRRGEAEALYTSAATVVDDAPQGCFADSRDPIEERRAVLADTRNRLDRKMAAVRQPPPPPPSAVATATPEPPPAPGAPPAPGVFAPQPPQLPPIGQQSSPAQGENPQPPLPTLPGENLPAPPPPPPSPPPPDPRGGEPLPVAEPATPNPPRILGPVGPDGLPLGDPDVAGPDLTLNPEEGAPIDRLRALLENANSFGGQRE